MITPRRFVDLITGAGQKRASVQSQGKPIRLATIDPAYASGNARVTFDGEQTLSGKAYPWANYQPVGGQRVVMVPQGNGYIIIGAIGVAPAGGGGGGVTDHGALTGLADDDHTQYVTHTEGNAAYAPIVHNHAASAIVSGTLGVPRGGTGLATVTAGNFLRGNGTSAMTQSTPAQVRDAIGATVTANRAEIANSFPTATNTWETWGVTPSYPNPGRPVAVVANFVGRFRCLDTEIERYNGGCRVDISIDGGATYTNGKALFSEVRGIDSPGATLLANMTLHSGTPTGTIIVRLMHQMAAGGVSAPPGGTLDATDFMDAAIQTLIIG